MKSFVWFQSVIWRSPPTPLNKGREYHDVRIDKGGEYHDVRIDKGGEYSRKGGLGRSQVMATFNKTIGLGGLFLIATLLATPANAHKIETQKDVGATIHIEPNDAPRAGETALTWFALTQKGGKVIPLNECDCKLSLYSQASTEKPLQQPQLKAVSQESYQGIPAATITFPAAGAYELQLQGNPKNGAKFSAFELKFDINVAPGIAAPKSSNVKVSSEVLAQKNTDLIISQTTPPWLTLAMVIGTIFTMAIALLVWRKLQRNN
jgi:hypothetical protein